jgi:cyclase
MSNVRRIIPCLDVKDGRVVKGVRFQQLRDAGDPAEQAAAYDAAGGDEVTFLDISATVEGRATLLHLVREVAARVALPLTVGGGVRRSEDARELLLSGADKVAINTAALHDPSIFTRAAAYCGAQSVVCAIDARREGQDGQTLFRVWSHGARKPTMWDAADWAKEAVKRGAGEILLTSIDRDGTEDGFDLELTNAVADAVPVPVIASGGAGKPEHFVEVFQKTRAAAALAASVFHFGKFTVAQVKAACAAAGIPVRWPL